MNNINFEYPDPLNPYKFTGNSQYPINDNNYVIAVKEDSYFADKNIVPLCYITEDYQFLGIDDEEIGNRILVSSPATDTKTEDIAVRFYKNELFKIFKGRIIPNDNYEHDSNLPKKWTFKNNLQHFNKDEIIEIFEAEIDYTKNRVQIKYKELISDRYFDTKQSFFIIQGDRLIGPFIMNSSDDEGFFIVEKGTLFKFGEYEKNKKNFVELIANNYLRRLIINKQEFRNSFVRDFDFISDKDLISWFNDELAGQNDSFFKQNELSEIIDEIEKASNLNGIIGNKQRADRISKILLNAKGGLITKQNLLKIIPEYQGVKEELEQLEIKRLDIRNILDTRTNELKEIESRILDKQNSLLAIKQELKELQNQVELEQNKIRDNIKNEINELENRKLELDIEIERERISKSNELEKLKKDIEYNEQRQLELLN